MDCATFLAELQGTPHKHLSKLIHALALDDSAPIKSFVEQLHSHVVGGTLLQFITIVPTWKSPKTHCDVCKSIHTALQVPAIRVELQDCCGDYEEFLGKIDACCKLFVAELGVNHKKKQDSDGSSVASHDTLATHDKSSQPQQQEEIRSLQKQVRVLKEELGCKSDMIRCLSTQFERLNDQNNRLCEQNDKYWALIQTMFDRLAPARHSGGHSVL